MDLDGDGYGDILSGSYSRRDEDMAGLFYVLRGQPGGTFRAAEVLLGTDGQPLIIRPEPQQDGNRKKRADDVERICSRPFAVDWDGDGHLDLVVGNYAGTFYWFKGLGKGGFKPQAEQLRTEGRPLRIAFAHSDPFVIDWDGDGDLDILSGTAQGGVQWAENKAGQGKFPDLRPFRWLIPAELSQSSSDDPVLESELQGPSGSTRVWAADVNGDGKLDLLVGDMVALGVPAKGLSDEQFRTMRKEWRKAIEEHVQKKPPDADQKAQEEWGAKLYEHWSKRKVFCTSEVTTGFVWLYLRK